ncbi:MAG: hypothetical protein IKU26_07430 [Clostridia bacterium]|nr:hypothetical protein [Clostridia bacterium]
MKSITPYIQEQISSHPGMQPRDLLKLCYQAAYGGDHLLLDMAQAEAYFDREYASVPARDEPLYEMISPEIARINLRAWKQAGLLGKWLFRLFALSAQMHTKGNLSDYLNQAETLNFSGFREARREYELAGCPAVHHSAIYRNLEQPAYRVVNSQMLRLIPILQRASLVQGENPHILAIDGRAASGKTTMADRLAYILAGAVIHMDHFFLPPELRTQERLAESGGNVHYERFKEEVLESLGKNEPFSYRRFDCSQMAYGPSVTVPTKPWRIVEGSYSLHPAFGTYYDLSVFSSVLWEEQLKRIEVRNGLAMLQMFQEKWIPMEEAYFEAFDIAGKAMVCC